MGSESHQAGPGWTEAAARSAGAILLFESVTGLAITFGPFHALTQWSLLAHTAAGLAGAGPLAVYLWRHWRAYQAQAVSDSAVLGYGGAGALAVCLASGVAVAVEALFGTRTTPWLRQLHLGSTVLVVAAAAAHIWIAWWRRKNTERARGSRGWAGAVVGVTGAGLAIIWALAAAYPGQRYRNEFPSDYSYLYGKERPFAPSLAKTASGGAIDARALAGSATCGARGCHQEIYEEWLPSAHRYAAMDPVFQGIQTVMAKQNGPESTRYCGGCHDPISLFSGTKNIFSDNLTRLEGYQEGISCVVCHSIQKTDIQGNANYTLSQPVEYLWQWSREGTPGAAARNFLIRTWPGPHNRLSKRMFKKPEFCAACHKQFIDQEVNRVGWVQLQNQFDNWAASHWNKKGDPKVTVECRECHMPLADSRDPARGDDMDYNRSRADGKHRSHRFLAANNFVPAILKLQGWERHRQLTERWLQGKVDIPEIREKWAEGPVVAVRVEAPEHAEPGDEIKVRVVLASNKVGHDYPTGPLDMIQSWVELTVRDGEGRAVYVSGRRDERNFLEPGTFLFKAEPVDQYGNLIDRHNLWEMVGVRYRRSLFPGYSDTVTYDVMCPSGVAGGRPAGTARQYAVTPQAEGPLRIEAKLNYRKVDQFLLNYVFGPDKRMTSPVVEIARAEKTVRVMRGWH